MMFKDKYTTADLLAASPDTEKDKIVLLNDSYAKCELIEELKESVKSLRVALSKVK